VCNNCSSEISQVCNTEHKTANGIFLDMGREYYIINNFGTEKYAFKRVLDNSPMLPECWGVVVLERR
jgi:hypothetical protein